MGIRSEQRGPQQTIARSGSVAADNEIEDSPCQCQTLGYPIPCLPEDIWCHIHSLMPMDAAARAACLSHAFLSSWRCYPKLILSSQTVKAHSRSLRRRVDSILRNHSGIGLKILGLHIDNNAPSLSSFHLLGKVPKFSLGEASQMMKVLSLYQVNAICYGRTELPSIMPNLESLYLGSSHEVDTPMLPSKFINLKHLCIQITSSTLSPSYDYSSLISFLDASPSLETWQLEVPRADMGHELVGSSHLRQLPERHHDHLKVVEMMAFNSTKSLVELTCCIVKSAVSLDRLTLDTLRRDGSPCCSDDFIIPYSKFVVEEASRAGAAIRRYIKDKLAPTTKLTVLEPCPRCHANAIDDHWV